MRYVIFLMLFFACTIGLAEHVVNPTRVPILVYHNFDPVKTGSMTINTSVFDAQMRWLLDHHYQVIPLKELVLYLTGRIRTLPPKSVVVTDDDGRRSVYTDMLPIVEKYHIPVTLFIYPQIISRAPYALTWEQLKTLQKTGLFDVEGHTYWHPNFRQEKKRLSEAAYEKLVYTQLVTSKNVIEKKLGTSVTLLAWPFGIHDAYLMQAALTAHYVMAFSIAHRYASKNEQAMAMPRFMIIASQNKATFESIIRHQSRMKR